MTHNELSLAVTILQQSELCDKMTVLPRFMGRRMNDLRPDKEQSWMLSVDWRDGERTDINTVVQLADEFNARQNRNKTDVEPTDG